MQLGALLEDLTVAKARAGIEKLVHLTPQTARVLRNGTEKIIPAEQVQVQDLLRVLPGETIPVDGVITDGQTSINQAVMTGESLPVDKTVGDAVSSGTVNQFGAFEMRATKVGADSSIQRMIQLVQSADAGKAKIVGLADRWAIWIVVIALTAAALTWLLSGQIIRAVTILVVFCPCALVLATPTAIMAAIGNATKHGFLVREGDALERLAGVTKIMFDKTGTLTYGTPKVIAQKSLLPEWSDTELYALCAAVEQFSEHPLGKAIVQSYQQTHGAIAQKAEQFQMWTGRGVSAQVSGVSVLAGNQKLLEEQQIFIPEAAQADIQAALQKGCTVIHMVADGKFAGYLVLSDTVRTESAGMIAQLKELNVQPVLLTGDHENAAAAIASQLQMTEVHANCLPEDKMRWIADEQQKQESVCMMGDGVNDAPALKNADIGIAMGKGGTDVAKNAADMILLDDNFVTIVEAVKQGRNIYDNIKKAIHFLISTNIGEIVTIFFGLVLGIKSPLLAIQLLWINLVTDSLPAIALGLEKEEENIMSRLPRNPKKNLFADGLWWKIIIEGSMLGMFTLLAFSIGNRLYSVEVGRTMAFLTLGILELVHSFNIKSEESIFKIGVLENKYLVGALVLGVILQVIVVVVSPLAQVFSLVPLTGIQWLYTILIAVAPIPIVEIQKAVNGYKFGRVVYVKNN